MRYGEHLEYFLDLEADTGTTPQPLIERPELSPQLAGIFEAFCLLSASRSYGFGMPNPISTADALSIAPHVEPLEPLRFLRAIRAMDALFLTHAESKAARNNPRKK